MNFIPNKYCITFFLIVTFSHPEENRLQIKDRVELLANSVGEQLKKRNIKRIAVLEFADKSSGTAKLRGRIGAGGEVFAAITESLLITKYGDSFSVIDRQRLKDVITETRFQTSDLVNSQKLSKLQRIEPVDALITGTVVRMNEKICLTLKAVAIPTAEVLASRSDFLKYTPDLVALFGESYYLPPAVNFTRKSQQVPKLVELGKATHPLSEVYSDVPYKLEVLVDNKVLPFYCQKNDVFVPAELGKAYQIKLTNNSNSTVSVALFIDGLNSINRKYEIPADSLKWVIMAQKSITVNGWQKGVDVANKFVFSDAGKSLAAQKNYFDEIGLITAIFYPEVAATNELTRGQVGTAEGAEVSSRIKRVSLSYDKSNPSAVLNVYYEMPQIVQKMIRLDRQK